MGSRRSCRTREVGLSPVTADQCPDSAVKISIPDVVPRTIRIPAIAGDAKWGRLSVGVRPTARPVAGSRAERPLRDQSVDQTCPPPRIGDPLAGKEARAMAPALLPEL